MTAVDAANSVMSGLCSLQTESWHLAPCLWKVTEEVSAYAWVTAKVRPTSQRIPFTARAWSASCLLRTIARRTKGSGSRLKIQKILLSIT
ncbi:hypothetical protein AGOR_G00005760 [Albula goreensis]|uniref:Uncharacterized protein n=1 Tax=Albula goreensis TaxID=1534307 RepID=A0A8T3E4T9_9TELE|nr:hypothetical protein AGOR_G00005760 [Albula goreensis]